MLYVYYIRIKFKKSSNFSRFLILSKKYATGTFPPRQINNNANAGIIAHPLLSLALDTIKTFTLGRFFFR